MDKQSSASSVTSADWQGVSKTRSPLKSFVRTNWSQDPFAYGAYSYLAKGSGNEDRIIVLEPIHDRVFFAGEALNANYQSSVHAAYESGLNIAMHIESFGHQRIAIIGAGICGLGAAKWLTDKGLDVVVFEGRDRIGGRIWTERRLGVAVDVGAAWIHSPDGNPISALADQANLKRVETDDTSIMRGDDGRCMWRLFAPGWIWDVVSQTPTGTELDKLNLKETEGQFKQYGYGYKGRDVKFINGYDEIFQTLDGDYKIQLSTKVVQIKHSEKAVEIGTEANEISEFDAVIVTVPLGVLKRKIISFEPLLSDAKQAAISRMGMGILDKLYLKFEERFWDQDRTIIFTPNNGLPRGQFNYWFNFERYLGEPIIMAFNAGEAALALSPKSDEAVVEHALDTLHLAYPSS